jgi:hypothetical protein
LFDGVNGDREVEKVYVRVETRVGMCNSADLIVKLIFPEVYCFSYYGSKKFLMPHSFSRQLTNFVGSHPSGAAVVVTSKFCLEIDAAAQVPMIAEIRMMTPNID